jgi:hypothetical protein
MLGIRNVQMIAQLIVTDFEEVCDILRRLDNKESYAQFCVRKRKFQTSHLPATGPHISGL